MDPRKVWNVPARYTTPATFYAPGVLGRARLTRKPYRAGRYYSMNGILGYRYFRTTEDVPVTMLQILTRTRWKTWMVDDPCHWEAMKEMARRFLPGRLLIGGLGLGLIVHALAYRPTQADQFDEILVVEREPDVIRLIEPYLPKWPQLRIEQADFYDVLQRRERWDTILVDLWVGEAKKIFPDFQAKREWIELLYPYPKTLTLYFGFQGWVDMIRDAYAQSAAVRPLLEQLQGEQR